MKLPALPQYSIPETRAFAAGALVLSAVLMGAAQWLPGAAWLAIFGLAPFWVALRRGTFLRDWARFAGLSGAFALAAFYWMPGGGGRSLLLLLFTIAKMALLAAVPAALFHFTRGRILAVPAGLMLAELAGRKLLPGVAWVGMGQPLADYPALAQLASVAGPEALTLAVAAVSVALALAVLRRSALPLAASAALMITLLIWGNVRVGAPSQNKRVFRVGVIQPLTSARDEASHAALIARLEQQIGELNKRFPPLIIFPETVFPGAVRPDMELAEFAGRNVSKQNVAMFFGTHEKNEKSEFFNAALLVTPQAQVTTYRKLRPTALVEAVPPAFPFPKPRLPIQAGSRKVVFSFHEAVYFSALLGMEDTFPDLAAGFQDRGAELLVALSDAHAFHSPAEALEHLRRAQLSALAAGLPMVRVASAGITCAIDSRGRVLHRLPAGSIQAGIFVVPLAATESVYSMIGDAGEIAIALLAAVAGLWAGAAGMAAVRRLGTLAVSSRSERRRPGFEHLR